MKLEINIHDNKVIPGDGTVMEHNGGGEVKGNSPQHFAIGICGAHSDVGFAIHMVAEKYQLPCVCGEVGGGWV